MDFSDNFPFKAPKCNLLTKIYNPLVSDKGEICEEVYKKEWGPMKRIPFVIDCFVKVVTDPVTSYTSGVNGVEAGP